MIIKKVNGTIIDNVVSISFTKNQVKFTVRGDRRNERSISINDFDSVL